MKQLPFIDLHQDLLLYEKHKELFPKDTIPQTGFVENRRAGAHIVVATAFPHVENHEYLNKKTNRLIESDLQEYSALYSAQNKEFQRIQNGNDISMCIEKNCTGLVLHVEGLNAFSGKQEDWNMLERWYELGLRSIGIVWNLSNSLGGGTLDQTQGLTPLGEKVILWLTEHNMIIDMAHMNEKTFWDVAERVEYPLVISHGNARSVCNDPRNYTDEQIKRIASSGGIIGIFFSKKFITTDSTASLGDVVRHIDHIRSIVGIDHIGIGSDFGGILSGFPEGLESVERLEVLWDALRKQGYTEEEVEKIACKNALRVLKTILSKNKNVQRI